MIERLTQLEEEIEVLKRQLAKGSKAMLIPMESLEPESYELTRKVTILVLPDDDSWIATLVDANINASGETIAAAVANLKDMMIELFESLRKEPKRKLGKQPACQLAFLRVHSQKVVR